jgi:hypothetical protein
VVPRARLWNSPFFRSGVLPVLALFLLLKLLAPLCFTYVGPNEFGIKVVRVALLSTPGVQPTVYDTGFHFVLKPLDASIHEIERIASAGN